MANYYHSKYTSRYSRNKKKNPARKALIIISLIIIIALAFAALLAYNVLYKNNIWLKDGKAESIYIPSYSSFDKVKKNLYSKGIILNHKTFEWLAQKKKYTDNIKAGHYVIDEEMGNNNLINLLRSGQQTPVKLIFNNIRTLDELAERVSEQIEADSLSIIRLLNNEAYLNKYGMTPENVKTIFIPNTYEFYWNTTAEEFIDRMYKEYTKFWSDARETKLTRCQLTKTEAIILASIIEKETTKNDEKARIAGVYINRLRRGWRLQADPSVVYAIKDFSIKRVLNYQKEIDSPYNTYLYSGLPPGPICLPSIASINAVLDFEEHNYLFFCAKDDMSGYHNFAATLRAHNKNARRYQKALDLLNIKK